MQSDNKIWPVYGILQKKKIWKNYIKAAVWKLAPSPFVFVKNSAQSPLENEMFEPSYLN